jgi:hypothetical protein
MDRITSRRHFLKLSALALGSLAARPWRYWAQVNAEWPDSEKLGRVALGLVNIRAKPYPNSPSVKVIYDDAVVPWLREVVGGSPGGYGSARWVETPDGFIYASRLQPVFNQPNQPLRQMPAANGFWAEVTVPYVDIRLRHAASAMWLREKLETGQPVRLYYAMIVWVDAIEVGEGGLVEYRVNERYGNPGDSFWVNGEALRPLTEAEVSPINPEAEEKKVVVNLTRQTLSCFEGRREVYFCRISTGAKFDAEGNAVDAWSTPPGPHPVYRKLVSLHMSGEKTGDWPAVGWTQIFATGGVAIHSTYWHNDFGIPRSHGCVNCQPADAKWVWRWTYPHASLEPGDVDVSHEWPPTGTIVDVVE